MDDRRRHPWRFLEEHFGIESCSSSSFPDETFLLKQFLSRTVDVTEYAYVNRRKATSVEVHDAVWQALFSYWICNRTALYTSDTPTRQADKTKTQMIPSSAILPWVALAHLHALHTDSGRSEAYLTCERDEWTLFSTSVADGVDGEGENVDPFRILRNDDGNVLCYTAPFEQSIWEVQLVCTNFCRRWREFNYDDLPRLHQYLRMLLRRCLLFSVVADFDGDVSQQDVFGCEMYLGSLLYPCYVSSKLERRTIDTSDAGFQATRRRAREWLMRMASDGKFNAIGSRYRMHLEQAMVMPGERECRARTQGVHLDDITTQMLVQEGRPQDFKELAEFFTKPLLDLLKKTRGTWNQQQLFEILCLNMYLSTFRWRFSETRLRRENTLTDTRVVRGLRYDDGPVLLVQLFNGFVPIFDGVYYASNNITDVFAQFVTLAERHNPELVRQYPEFFIRIAGTTRFGGSGGGGLVSESESESERERERDEWSGSEYEFENGGDDVWDIDGDGGDPVGMDVDISMQMGAFRNDASSLDESLTEEDSDDGAGVGVAVDTTSAYEDGSPYRTSTVFNERVTTSRSSLDGPRKRKRKRQGKLDTTQQEKKQRLMTQKHEATATRMDIEKEKEEEEGTGRRFTGGIASLNALD